MNDFLIQVFHPKAIPPAYMIGYNKNRTVIVVKVAFDMDGAKIPFQQKTG
jgi:hypothetical protein